MKPQDSQIQRVVSVWVLMGLSVVVATVAQHGHGRTVKSEQLNDGPAATPRLAASLILLRDMAGVPELLMVRRNPAQRFMGGYWVFPGGAVDAHEGVGEAAHRTAAVRELREEAGVNGVRVADLVKYGHWITPEPLSVRFDTHFYVARAPAGADGRCDGNECVDLRWDSPRAVLDAHRGGELALAFPTRRLLDELSAFATVDELLRDARGRTIRPMRPRIVRDGASAHVALPGEEPTPRP